MARPSPPRLSVVLLTWNEERNIGACLASLARQRCRDFEVIVVDAASTDGTVAALEAVKVDFPVPLRVEVAERRISIGEARNRGVALTRAPVVAFLSADAEAGEDWVAEGLRGMAFADMVFGRQTHAPSRWSVGATVRGLRYHFPTGSTDKPLRYASNVSAFYKKEILRSFPFDAWANAAEDLLLAKRAVDAGYRATYNPLLFVRHRDVMALREELRKNLREGEGWGIYADELGLFAPLLGWGVVLSFAGLMLLVSPGLPTLLFAGAVLWFPALRRAWRRGRDIPKGPLVIGVLASPAFDVAFLLTYVRGLLVGRRGREAKAQPRESES